MLAEPAVSVLEYERVQHGAVDAGVECLAEDFVVGVKGICSEGLLPSGFCFGEYCLEVFAVQFL